MTDQEFERIVRTQADDIRSRIRNGTLYGRPIDPTEMDQILVAAFFCGAHAPFQTSKETE